MKFEAVLFDLDGTLLESLTGIADAMNILLDRLDYPRHPLDAYRYFVGDGLEQLVRRAIPGEKLSRHDIPKLVAQYREVYQQTWPQTTRPYDGISELLDALSEKSLKLGVISNKSESFTREMVEVLLPRWRFDTVVGQRPGVPLKPDPFAALDIARRLGVPPEKFLFVGDTRIDMETAVRAGMVPVGALWGFRDAEELKQAGAAHLISHPTDLLFLTRCMTL